MSPCSSKCDTLMCDEKGAITHKIGPGIKPLLLSQLRPALAPDGRPIMVAVPGNKKYKADERHPQCLDCFITELQKKNQKSVSDTLTFLEKGWGK